MILQNLVIPISPPTIVNVKDPEMEKGARLESINPKLNVITVEASDMEFTDDLRVLLGGGSLDPQSTLPDEADALKRNMMLETRAPVESAAVLRGSTPPIWFPGYNVALPNTAHPTVMKDPEVVLDEAWFQSQPLSLKLEEKGAKLIGS
jgi:hypothetical protein